MADPQGVLIVGEVTNGQLDETTKELLAHGRNVADKLGEHLSVALLGENLGELPKEAIAFGADTVYVVADPLLKEFQVDVHLAALAKVSQEHSPRVILLAKTQVGSEVGPRLAFRLDTGLVQDCTEVSLDLEAKRLLGHRPIFGGNCTAVVACSWEPMMAVIRPKAAEPLERDDIRQGEVVTVLPGLDPSIAKNRVVERVQEKQAGLRVEDAAIVIAGGRGLGGPDPFFGELQHLADMLGAAVGGTRAVVDAGWVPYSYQIGLTGKTITPDLYITVGISGASQHMAGCRGAKVIVAINRDAECNIFKEARYGVVGDWTKVLTAFTEQIRELM